MVPRLYQYASWLHSLHGTLYFPLSYIHPTRGVHHELSYLVNAFFYTCQCCLAVEPLVLYEWIRETKGVGSSMVMK